MASIQRGEDPEEVLEVLERLGEGSYGKVYKAVMRSTAQVVALKLVPLEGDECASVTREIAILEACASPFVVQYFGSFLFDAHLWISMEFCAAGSLADLMELRGRCLDERQVAAVCANVALGLEYLHARRSLHRDVKAGNVLLAADGHAKLADFGVSAQLTSTLNKRRTVIGTPFWMAPEVIQESQYDGRADVWSLGITAIELAEGAPPLARMHPMRAVFLIPSRPPPTLARPEAFSPLFADFLATCLRKDARERPAAAELLAHPFIRRDVDKLRASTAGLAVLQELVDENLELVRDARDARAQDERAFRSATTGRADGSLSVQDLSSMLRSGGTARSTASDTMRFSASATDTMRPSSGDGSAAALAQAFGTMVFQEGDACESVTGGLEPSFSGLYGTMVPGSAIPPPAPTGTMVLSDSAGDEGGQRDSGTMKAASDTAEPSFMRYFRQNQGREDPAASKSEDTRQADYVPESERDAATLHRQLAELQDAYDRDCQELARRFAKQKLELERQLEELQDSV